MCFAAVGVVRGLSAARAGCMNAQHQALQCVLGGLQRGTCAADRCIGRASASKRAPAQRPQVFTFQTFCRGGLERRGKQETKYLKELEVIAESGVTQVGAAPACSWPCDACLRACAGGWGRSW